MAKFLRILLVSMMIHSLSYFGFHSSFAGLRNSKERAVEPSLDETAALSGSEDQDSAQFKEKRRISKNTKRYRRKKALKIAKREALAASAKGVPQVHVPTSHLELIDDSESDSEGVKKEKSHAQRHVPAPVSILPAVPFQSGPPPSLSQAPSVKDSPRLAEQGKTTATLTCPPPRISSAITNQNVMELLHVASVLAHQHTSANGEEKEHLKEEAEGIFHKVLLDPTMSLTSTSAAYRGLAVLAKHEKNPQRVKEFYQASLKQGSSHDLRSLFETQKYEEIVALRYEKVDPADYAYLARYQAEAHLRLGNAPTVPSKGASLQSFVPKLTHFQSALKLSQKAKQQLAQMRLKQNAKFHLLQKLNALETEASFAIKKAYDERDRQKAVQIEEAHHLAKAASSYSNYYQF